MVVFIYADSEKEYNCSHWRSYLPSSFLHRYAGWDTVMHSIKSLDDPKTQEDLHSANIVFVERILSSAIFVKLDIIRATTGAKIIFDMDDAYRFMEPGTESYNFWLNGLIPAKKGSVRMPVPPIEQIGQLSKNVDAISSPSKLILEDWKDYNDNLLWLPNFADADLYDPIPFREDKKIVVGWGGGATHYTSWYASGLLTAFRRVYQRHSKDIQLTLVTGDQTLVHKLKDCNPSSTRSDRLLYPQEISKFDIALAPLCGEYDRRRSWLKIAEYSLSGIPWIASDIDPYRDYNYPGSILVRNKPADWEEALEEMIKSRQEYHTKVKDIGYSKWRQVFSIQENYEFLINQFRKEL